MAEDEKKDQPVPGNRMDFKIRNVEEFEERGSLVAPQMRLPDGVELPSLAPIPENPAVIVEPMQSMPIEPPRAAPTPDEE